MYDEKRIRIIGGQFFISLWLFFIAISLIGIESTLNRIADNVAPTEIYQSEEYINDN